MMEEINEIHDGRRERLRYRLMEGGPEELKPHELLEFLLYYAVPRQDMNELSHALLERFGSVRAVIHADEDELMKVGGMGLTTVRWLKMLYECGKICDRLGDDRQLKVVTCGDSFRIARSLAREMDQPCFLQLCMDENDNLIYRRALCYSYSWGEPEILRRALSDALTLDAKRVLLILLAGRRVSYPSRYDEKKVRAYAYTLSAAGVSLADMVILGCTGPMSLRRMGIVHDKIRTLPPDTCREEAPKQVPDEIYFSDLLPEDEPEHYIILPEENHECTEPV